MECMYVSIMTMNNNRNGGRNQQLKKEHFTPWK